MIAVPSWAGWLGMGLTVLSMGLALLFFARSRQRKTLAYAIRSVNVIRGPVSIAEGVSFRYRDREVDTLTSSAVAIWSAGNRTIEGSDITSAEPLAIEAVSPTRILDARIAYVHSRATSFAAELATDGSRVTLRFDYLDTGDGGVLQVLHTGASSDCIAVVGRIKGAGAPARRSVLPGLVTNPTPRRLTPHSGRKSSGSRGSLAVVGLFYILMPIGAAVSLFLSPSPAEAVSHGLAGKIAGTVFFFAVGWLTGWSLLKRRLPQGYPELLDPVAVAELGREEQIKA